MTIGIPFYGCSVTSSGIGQLASKDTPKGNSDDGLWAKPCLGAASVYSRFWKWTNLRSKGVVGDKDKAISGGWKQTWDNTSQTPWLVHAEKNLFISYDDRTSLGKKGDAIKQNGLAGVMAWSINMDHNNELVSILARIK
jgi:chitinase